MVQTVCHGLLGRSREAGAGWVMLAVVVVAFALLATLPLSSTGAGNLGPDVSLSIAAPVDPSTWDAWINKMPPGPKALHVRGTVTVSHPGHLVRLALAEPQGGDPRELILDLEVTPLPGYWPQVVSSKQVSFKIDDYRSDYRSILVRFPDGSGVTLAIQEAH